MGQLIVNRNCYEVSKPEMEFDMMNIIYMALHMYKNTTIVKFFLCMEFGERDTKGQIFRCQLHRCEFHGDMEKWSDT